MPPKKVLKTDHQQCKLTSFLKNTSSSAEEPKTDTPSVDYNDNVVNDVSKEVSEKKKDRKFQTKWLGLYSWLRYVPSEQNAEDYMFCSVCTDHNKVNGMTKLAKNQNFQHSTLTRHVSLSEHKMCMEAPLLRGNMAQCQLKHESREDKAMKVLLKCIHWISSENLPLTKFKSLINLLHDLEVPDISILKQNSMNYDSEFTASEMLDSLAQVAEDDLNDQLTKSPVVTVLSDESTDISNTKRLVIYAQVISQDMRPFTLYVNNIECNDASGKGIAAALLEEFAQRGVPAKKIMSMGSDGASVMTGKHNGIVKNI